MLDWNENVGIVHLQSFVAVAREGGMTRAAESLQLGKSVVSKHISQLEASLESRLFERNSRSVLLTRVGAVLLPKAQSILIEFASLKADATEERSEVRGMVRIASSVEFGVYLSAALMPALLARHPLLRVHLALRYFREDLHDPSFDLAIRVGEVGDDRLVVKSLGFFRRVVVASPKYLASTKIRSIDDFKRGHALLFSENEEDWAFTSTEGDTRSISVRGRFAVQSFSALAAAAEGGLGLARVPAFVVKEALKRRSLCVVAPAWKVTPAAVSLAHRPGATQLGRVRAVADFVRERLPKLLMALR
jgi:DNA-binding transcriptional LysR family regulator